MYICRLGATAYPDFAKDCTKILHANMLLNKLIKLTMRIIYCI